MAIGGLGYVEAIKQGYGLIGLGASDVRLAGLILNNAGNEIDGVAVIVGRGEDHVDDIESADLFLRGDLGGIDGGSGFVDVDNFVDFLDVGDCDFEGGGRVHCNAGLLESVEAFLLDVQLVLPGGKVGKATVSDEIGLAAPDRLRRGMEGDTGGGDGYAVFVEDDDCGRGGSLRAGGRGKDNPPQRHGGTENCWQKSFRSWEGVHSLTRPLFYGRIRTLLTGSGLFALEF